MSEIPFVDVQGQTSELHDEVLAAMDEVLATASFVNGPALARFEVEFCAALKLPAGLGCSSGTSALSLLLEAAGIGAHDEVITTAHTFIATAEAICHVRATPVFADIEAGPYTLDPSAVEAAITARTRAIMPVHLYGTPADMDGIREIARRHDLIVIEDAAQAHLATYGDESAGAMGDGAGFSFYPGKNLGAFGDAGFLTTRHPDWLERAGKLLDHGRATKYEHELIGYNHRMDTLQAAVLSVKLRHLSDWTARRQAVALIYDAALREAGFKVIDVPTGRTSVYHLYEVEVSNRHDVLDHLRSDAVGCGIHYPMPLHLQPALAHLGGARGDLPVTEAAADRVISLPIDGRISDDHVERALESFLSVAKP